MLQVLQPKQMDPGARKKIRLIKSMEPEWGHLGIFLNFVITLETLGVKSPIHSRAQMLLFQNFLCVCRGNLELAPTGQ